MLNRGARFSGAAVPVVGPDRSQRTGNATYHGPDQASHYYDKA
jgi:lipoate-protein ligase B